MLSVIYKYCLYNSVLHQTGNSKCMVVVLVPGKSVHVNPVPCSIPYALVRGNCSLGQNSGDNNFRIYYQDVLSQPLHSVCLFSSQLPHLDCSLNWVSNNRGQNWPCVNHSCSLKWIRAGLTCSLVFHLLFVKEYFFLLNAFIRDFKKKFYFLESLRYR